MKAPLSWIKEYIDLEGIGIEELANILTSVGLEVENVLLVGVEKPAGKLKNKYAGLLGIRINLWWLKWWR